MNGRIGQVGRSGALGRWAALITAGTALAGADQVAPQRARRWQTVTLTFDGPQSAEDATPNPFRDYRMSVFFSHQQSGASRTAQGFFAADGNAAESSATAGNKWRVRFTPPDSGAWSWRASFHAGADIALTQATGEAVAFDGESGTLTVGSAPSAAQGFEASAS